MPRLLPIALGPIALGAITGAFLVHERRTRRSAERLAAATLEALLRAIDANDAQTGAHVRRVATYALVLGDALGLDERELRGVEQVALFHDIGKIHSALFDIIHDRAKLTPAERRKVTTHPRRGAEVLESLAPFFPDLAEGVLSHHERWDGSGYPRGLRGEEIPLTARIVAIADTFDAITHDRRYRCARSPASAIAVLVQGRGTQFDPQLVDLFILPPVFQRALGEMRRAHSRAEPRPSERRTGREERHTPKITFRWRLSVAEQRARGQEQRTPT